MEKSNVNQNMLSEAEQTALLSMLTDRFAANPGRHAGLAWEVALQRLLSHPEKLWSLQQMETSGGEPDVIGWEPASGELTFCDCSAESPEGRRNVCYDQAALAARKSAPPPDSALGMASRMGVELLGEQEYRRLQQLEAFDTKTSSWLLTPEPIRKLDGALFGDRRYDMVFVYHNSAPSYYGARGFRALLRV